MLFGLESNAELDHYCMFVSYLELGLAYFNVSLHINLIILS